MLYTRTVDWNSKRKENYELATNTFRYVLYANIVALFDEMLPESCKMLFANVNTMIVYKRHKHLGVRILQMLWRPIVIVVITEWMFMVNIVLLRISQEWTWHCPTEKHCYWKPSQHVCIYTIWYFFTTHMSFACVCAPIFGLGFHVTKRTAEVHFKSLRNCIRFSISFHVGGLIVAIFIQSPLSSKYLTKQLCQIFVCLFAKDILGISKQRKYSHS